jgi:hypothetical protein
MNSELEIENIPLKTGLSFAQKPDKNSSKMGNKIYLIPLIPNVPVGNAFWV